MNKIGAKSLTLLINYGDDQQVKHFHLHLIPDFSKSKNNNLKDIEEIYNIIK